MQFTDYSGQQPYLDYDVEFDFEADPPTADAYDTMRYLDGSTVHAQQAASSGAARYYHGDLTGSTNALTDTSGAMLTGGTTTNGGPFYYTSFGERVYYDTSSSSWKLGGEFPIGSPCQLASVCYRFKQYFARPRPAKAIPRAQSPSQNQSP